jgi:uncharacterized ion transporter superfamily protein YfcC
LSLARFLLLNLESVEIEMNKMYPILAYAPRPRFWNSARVRRVAFASALVFVIMYLVFRYWHPVFFATKILYWQSYCSRFQNDPSLVAYATSTGGCRKRVEAEKGSEANSEKWLLTLFPCLFSVPFLCFA